MDGNLVGTGAPGLYPHAEACDVKMEKAPGAYHHGDLRTAIIAAGLARLRAGDSGELGLRALARAVGVSAPSLYRYFPSKEALLDALADEGIQRLKTKQAEAWAKAGGGLAGLEATGVAYVRFAHDEPAFFRLSFTRQMSNRNEGNGDSCLFRVRAGETMAWAKGADIATLHAWALVHGLAMLILDRRIEWSERMVEQVIRLTFGPIDQI